MDYRLSMEDMNRLQLFLDNKASDTIYTDLPERLNRLCNAVNKKCVEEARKAIRAKVNLDRKVEKLQDGIIRNYPGIQFKEMNRDSLEVAYAIKHIANNYGHYIRRTMLIPILYDVYANWIYSAKEILTDEQPKATENGPQFWKVYTKIDMRKPVNETKRYYDALASFNSGVIALIKNVLNKYINMDDSRVAEIMRNNVAYINADKSHNNGKWNKVIEPRDIYAWKKETNK